MNKYFLLIKYRIQILLCHEEELLWEVLGCLVLMRAWVTGFTCAVCKCIDSEKGQRSHTVFSMGLYSRISANIQCSTSKQAAAVVGP